MSLPADEDTSPLGVQGLAVVGEAGDDPTVPAVPASPGVVRPGEAQPSLVDWAARSVPGTRAGGNQDAWGQHDGVLFVVADGMGGHHNGALAARTAVDGLLALAEVSGSWQQRLEALDTVVRERALHDGLTGGTTLAAVSLHGDRVTVVSVGDSRVYRCRGASVEQLSRDHTLRDELLGAGIDADQHASPRQARGLTSYLGIGAERLRSDVIDVAVRAGDRLLLCTDGAYRAANTATLVLDLGAPTCAQAVDRLLARGSDASSRDDATALVLELA